MTHCTIELFRAYLGYCRISAQDIIDEIEEFEATLDEFEGKKLSDDLCPYHEQKCKIAQKYAIEQKK